ncbi:hypothetical protein COT99_00680 [Candidatus Falkowbacteria bacterium CG10_big_fil_rev_8_21_14_0_10_43_10]|uniref:Glycogen synthase n=1 Tax=Candidatus Falkowbacteria bacterium CG10_big_fil_rev_8_21_14_0_10_43_10 TaxID=1974567 RepID=A0A2H0V324_9BACT|nr:MAG: hypothetical protein COT99_00680 [Candidatus Falkowbacteria bacterium CG10_big_fil_rev_8_21_14_0_10_43_10]
MKPLKIIHIASEVDPFSKTGGLADVARSLPKAQKRLGYDVCVITPMYGQIIDKEKQGIELIEQNIKLHVNSEDIVNINIYRGYLMQGLPVYFIENTKYFSKRKSLYGSSRENSRFMVFNAGVLRLISMLDLKPDIIHCHDWHTGLIPYYIKTKFHYAKKLGETKTIYTIHNLVFQMGMNWWEVPSDHKDYGKTKLPHLDSLDIKYINFAKRAIMNADIINAVSEHYAEEILTKKFGQDLQRILKNRQHKLYGIVNGIDYNELNPATDPGLHKNFNYKNAPAGKRDNKKILQKKFNLPADPNIPIIIMTSRIVYQKGFTLILNIMEHILALNLQFIVIGAGDKKYITELQKFSKKYPDKLAVIPSHEENQKYETLTYAGGDIFLLPSHHEPCGLNQMSAMRYGCVPIVHRVGGLYDTVTDYDPAEKNGTGFVFNIFNGYELYGAIVRAVEIFKNKRRWKELVRRDMRESNSWEIPAKKYIDLYRTAINIKEK